LRGKAFEEGNRIRDSRRRTNIDRGGIEGEGEGRRRLDLWKLLLLFIVFIEL
jgi:hypothetical protein